MKHLSEAILQYKRPVNVKSKLDEFGLEKCKTEQERADFQTMMFQNEQKIREDERKKLIAEMGISEMVPGDAVVLDSMKLPYPISPEAKSGPRSALVSPMPAGSKRPLISPFLAVSPQEDARRHQ